MNRKEAILNQTLQELQLQAKNNGELSAIFGVIDCLRFYLPLWLRKIMYKEIGHILAERKNEK